MSMNTDALDGLNALRDDREMSRLVSAIARQMHGRYCRAGVLDWERVEEHLERLARSARRRAARGVDRLPGAPVLLGRD